MTAYPDLGPLTPEDEALVADYVLAEPIQAYLRRHHLMTIREHADSLDECSNPDNQYDKSDYFSRKILPLLQSLEEACAAEGLPYVYSVQFGMDERSNSTMMCAKVGGDTLYPGAPIRQMAAMMNVLMERPTED